MRKALAPFAAALTLWPAIALARGGGGGHSGGGGGHSGGGHSSGGHGGFGHGGFGHMGGYGVAAAGGSFVAFGIVLLVLIVVVYIAYRVLRGSRTASSGAPMVERAVQTQDADLAGAGAVATLAAIRAADPDFEPETFLQRSEMTFFLVKRAYQHRDLAGAQPYLVPAVFASWSTGVEQLLAEHRRPLLDNLNVRGLHVADAAHDPATGDSIVVHFDIVFRGKMIDDRDGRVLSDTGDDNRYGERWTFVRATGAKSVASGGVVAQKCPSCGAPLELGADGHCKFCHAEVATGAFDWSVAAMEPAAFSGVALDPLLGLVQMPPDQGLAAIQASDPAFDPKTFMARVNEAFGTLQTAWQARNVDGARGFMSPGLYFSWSTQVEQMSEQHRRNVLDGLRVDSIVPVRVLHGHVFDDVTVRIDARCADYEIDETSQRIVFGDKTVRPFTEYWTFQRAVDVKTTDRSLLDKVCPNCGAPLDVTQLGECKYCKAAVTSGRFDWVLSRIEQAEEYE